MGLSFSSVFQVKPQEVSRVCQSLFQQNKRNGICSFGNDAQNYFHKPLKQPDILMGDTQFLPLCGRNVGQTEDPQAEYALSGKSLNANIPP